MTNRQSKTMIRPGWPWLGVSKYWIKCLTNFLSHTSSNLDLGCQDNKKTYHWSLYFITLNKYYHRIPCWIELRQSDLRDSRLPRTTWATEVFVATMLQNERIYETWTNEGFVMQSAPSQIYAAVKITSVPWICNVWSTKFDNWNENEWYLNIKISKKFIFS